MKKTLIYKLLTLKRCLIILILLAINSNTEIYAIDECTLFEHEIEYEGYSTKYKQHAIKERFQFCLFDFESNKSKTGMSLSTYFEFEFIKVFTLKGKLKRKFLYNGNSTLLSKLSNYVKNVPAPFKLYLEGKVLSRRLIVRHLKEGRFKKTAPSLISPNGKCSIRIFQPVKQTIPVTYKIPIIYFNAGESDYFLSLIDSGMYSGHLSTDAYWFNKKSDSRGHKIVSPRLLIILKQNGGWAPGSPGSYNTQELIWIDDEEKDYIDICF